LKAETEAKGWEGDVYGPWQAKRGGNKPGYTFFSGLLGQNFFQSKNDKAEAALELRERNVKRRGS
jgi:hypothetical protein